MNHFNKILFLLSTFEKKCKKFELKEQQKFQNLHIFYSQTISLNLL